MADVFNKYFSTIGINTANSTASNSNPLEYMNYSFQESFFLSPVTTYEIELEISRINVSKTTGPFSIPSSLIEYRRSLVKIFIFHKLSTVSLQSSTGRL